MFDDGSGASLADLRLQVERVRGMAVAGDDAARIEQIALLEELKRATSAAQARVTAELAASQRAEQVAQGVPTDRGHRRTEAAASWVWRPRWCTRCPA